jgi:excinuclease ABC subunit A
VADRIIDLGPEGGEEGGKIVAAGTPEEVAAVPGSYTGRFLADVVRPAKKAPRRSRGGAPRKVPAAA